MEEKKIRVKKIIPKLKRLFPRSKIALNFSNNIELLVAVQLSAQCTDKKVNEVTIKLFKKYPNLDAYVNASASRRTIREFEQDIRQCGFYRNKTKNILAACKMIKEKFGGKVPKTMDEMLELPGVARKTANIVLYNAHKVVEGIAVDTHVKRLAKRMGLTNHSDPVKIERDLMEIVPRKEWSTFNYLLVDYGRKYCKAKRHDHDSCPLKEFDVA